MTSAGSPGSRAPALAVALGGALGGLLFAWYLYGLRILDPRSVEWLHGESDALSHFLGWDFFRRDRWRWPPGMNPTYGTLLRSSIVFTDSIPGVALGFKAVARWLPDPFQYQGLVLYANLALDGASSAILALRLSRSRLAAVLFSLLAVSLPIVTLRGIGGHGHESLTATWLLWVAIGGLLVPDEQASRRKHGAFWSLLLTLAASIHFYLLVCVGVLWITGALARRAPTVPARWTPLARELAATLALPLAAMWIEGYFAPPGSVGDVGYGSYSAEVLTFLNPASGAWFLSAPGHSSLSTFVSGWRSPIEGQYEGQAYLGLGALGLLAVAAGLHCVRRPATGAPPRPRFGAAWWAAGLLFVVAMGDRWVIGRSIVHVPLPGSLLRTLAVVRSSGRLCWPLAFVLLAASLSSIARRWTEGRVVAVLALALILQVFDLSGWHRSIRAWARRDVPRPAALDDPVVAAWATNRRGVTLLPPTALAQLPPFAWIAARHGMRINVGRYARMSVDDLGAAAQADIEAARLGHLDPSELYVLADTDLASDVCAEQSVRCHAITRDVVVAIAAN